MKPTVSEFLKQTLPTLRIAVVGDVMLDRYIYGDVSRISPEAPVPVNRVTGERSVLGGAANTAANLAALSARVSLFGARGEDENGSHLLSLCDESGIDAKGILPRKNVSTITKIRILGARQQMLRLDFEEKQPLSETEEAATLAALQNAASGNLSAVVLSDYGKGFLTDNLIHSLIALGNEKQIPVLIDPKGADWTKYTGAFALTPNLKELSEALDAPVSNTDEDVTRAGNILRDKYRLTYLFVTRSEKGITAIGEKETLHSPAAARDVFDVSGAGDTVMAILAASAAAALPMPDALRLANTAGGIAVSRVGTYPVKQAELLEAWEAKTPAPDFAPATWEATAEKIRAWQARGETVVFTNGCFDILHRGHVTYLAQAKALGDRLVVGVNSDDSVRRLKGESRPVNRETDRALLLAALRFVDEVVIFGEDTPEKLLEKLRPDILVKGGDYKKEDVKGKEFAGRVEILPFVEGCSTTNVIEKIKGQE